MFKSQTKNPNETYIIQNNARQHSIDLANSITFVKLAEQGFLDDTTITEHINLFPDWVEGAPYPKGSIVKMNGMLYRCNFDNLGTAAATLSADDEPLWNPIGDSTAEYLPWARPIGVKDAYMQDDMVSYDGSIWISEIDNNVYLPGTQGWTLIEGE